MDFGGREKAIKDVVVAQNNGKEFMALAVAASIAVCHVNTLRRAIAAGTLKASRRARNGRLLVWAGDLAHWICAGEALAAPGPNTPRPRRRKSKCDDSGAHASPIQGTQSL
ncbi:MAG: hypothetical protein IPP14_05735 [Planctomycetes bacterium]|nr:hypothetical protein [Planctomycetota bacterium]